MSCTIEPPQTIVQNYRQDENLTSTVMPESSSDHPSTNAGARADYRVISDNSAPYSQDEASPSMPTSNSEHETPPSSQTPTSDHSASPLSPSAESENEASASLPSPKSDHAASPSSQTPRSDRSASPSSPRAKSMDEAPPSSQYPKPDHAASPSSLSAESGNEASPSLPSSKSDCAGSPSSPSVKSENEVSPSPPSVKSEHAAPPSSPSAKSDRKASPSSPPPKSDHEASSSSPPPKSDDEASPLPPAEIQAITSSTVSGTERQTTAEFATTSLRHVNGNSNMTSAQIKWEEMFLRLQAFKERHGHCLVPNRYHPDPQLGSWVSTQRRQYKILTSGTSESTPMTVERATKLMSIGFVWATRDPRHVPWEIRYKELCAYKKKHGDCLVPIGYKDNVQLANWVSTQRQEYKLLRDRRPTRLTSERIHLLEQVGFVWEAQRGGPRPKKRSRMDDPSQQSSTDVADRVDEGQHKGNVEGTISWQQLSESSAQIENHELQNAGPTDTPRRVVTCESPVPFASATAERRGGELQGMAGFDGTSLELSCESRKPTYTNIPTGFAGSGAHPGISLSSSGSARRLIPGNISACSTEREHSFQTTPDKKIRLIGSYLPQTSSVTTDLHVNGMKTTAAVPTRSSKFSAPTIMSSFMQCPNGVRNLSHKQPEDDRFADADEDDNPEPQFRVQFLSSNLDNERNRMYTEDIVSRGICGDPLAARDPFGTSRLVISDTAQNCGNNRYNDTYRRNETYPSESMQRNVGQHGLVHNNSAVMREITTDTAPHAETVSTDLSASLTYLPSSRFVSDPCNGEKDAAIALLLCSGKKK